MDNYYNCNHGDYCHDNRSEEPVHTLPIIAGDGSTVNMEMSLMNQSEDDHSGGQEETRGSRLCCDVVNECCHGDTQVAIVIKNHQRIILFHKIHSRILSTPL